MQTIERTALSELITNEDYARKVLPHMKRDYFSDRSERIVFEEIQKFVEKYNTLPNKTSIEIEIDSRRDLNEQDVKAVIDVVKSLEKDDNVITFGPGKIEHKWGTMRGMQEKPEGNTVYINGHTPFKHTIEIS